MKRIIVLAGILALSVAGLASAAGSGAKIDLRKTAVGKVLVNRRGRTIYSFTRDSRNMDRCMKIKFCASTWPPVTTKGKPIPGTGVKGSKLGSIKLPNGKHQVTYAGHPLYTYSGDTRPGQTIYVGVPMYGGQWDAMSASGKLIK